MQLSAPDTDLVEEVEENDDQSTHDEHEVKDNDDQTTLEEHELTEQPDMCTPVDQVELKVVMVKRKTLWWQGQVIKKRKIN